MADQYTVIRTTTIDAPAAQIFSEMVDFHRWPAWSPWEDLDPDMQRTYSGAESGVGADYAWSGNRKAGAGTMKIAGAVEPSQLTIDLAFLKPFKSESTIIFDLEESGDSTEVTWRLVGHNTLMTKIMGIFKSMDSLVGPDFQKGLAQLKSTVESNGS